MASYTQFRCFSSGPRAATGTSSREAAPSAVVNYGRILGVGPNASKGEVKAAYRKLALQCHPDVCGSDESEVDFMEVNRAYESLMAHQSSHCFSTYANESASYNSGFGAAAPASVTQDDDQWADFMQSPLRVASDEELQVDYSSYYSNLKSYGSKASRSKNSYPRASQYYQGNW